MQAQNFEKILKIIKENTETHLEIIFDTETVKKEEAEVGLRDSSDVDPEIGIPYPVDFFTDEQQEQLVAAFEKNKVITSIKVGFKDTLIEGSYFYFDEFEPEWIVNRFFPIRIFKAHPQLESLDFSNCKLAPGAVGFLLSELTKNKVPLQRLDLSRNTDIGGDNNNDCLQEIAEYIRATTTLKYLYLSTICSDRTNLIHFSHFLLAVNTSRSLRRLDLSHNPGFGPYLPMLAAISDNPRLEFIDMSDCNISGLHVQDSSDLFTCGPLNVQRPIDIVLDFNPDIAPISLEKFEKLKEIHLDSARLKEQNLADALADLKQSFRQFPAILLDPEKVGKVFLGYVFEEPELVDYIFEAKPAASSVSAVSSTSAASSASTIAESAPAASSSSAPSTFSSTSSWSSSLSFSSAASFSTLSSSSSSSSSTSPVTNDSSSSSPLFVEDVTVVPHSNKRSAAQDSADLEHELVNSLDESEDEEENSSSAASNGDLTRKRQRKMP